MAFSGGLGCVAGYRLKALRQSGLDAALVEPDRR